MNRQYELRVRARDKAGNQGTFPNTLTSTVRLTFDGAKPISGIATPRRLRRRGRQYTASIAERLWTPDVALPPGQAVSLIIQDVGGRHRAVRQFLLGRGGQRRPRGLVSHRHLQSHRLQPGHRASGPGAQ